MIKVTYQKKNGDIIERYNNKFISYKVGYINSYGWKVINIKYCYNGKYYDYNKYEKLSQRRYYFDKLFWDLKKKVIKACGDIGRLFFLLILFRTIVNSVKI